MAICEVVRLTILLSETLSTSIALQCVLQLWLNDVCKDINHSFGGWLVDYSSLSKESIIKGWHLFSQIFIFS